MAAREGTSGLWAGGVGASLECRTVSSTSGNGKEQGNQVTVEKGGGKTEGWGEGAPLPNINPPAPTTLAPAEEKENQGK